MARRNRRTECAACIALLASCTTPNADRELARPPVPPAPVEAASLALPPPPMHAGAPRAIDWQTLGRSVEGRPIEAAVFGSGRATVLVMASIHGDEAAGTPLLLRLADELARAPDWSRDRRVVVIPIVNPDGFERGTRRNARAVDLNRNFPAANWHARDSNGPAALSEPEARAVAKSIRDDSPDRILSFHQPADSIDWDGPAAELAAALAARSPLAVRRLGARPGSLGSWAGVDLGIPTITVELPRSADRLDSQALWQTYGELLIAAIAFE